jgi:hypothetical protein
VITVCCVEGNLNILHVAIDGPLSQENLQEDLFWRTHPLFLVSGFWFLVSGFWFLVSGFWFLVSGFWFLVSGFWFLVSGFWGARSKRCGMHVINDFKI